MAKKNKDVIPNPNSVPNRDVLQRLNFLYQASAYLNGLAPPSRSVPGASEPPISEPAISTSKTCKGEKNDVEMQVDETPEKEQEKAAVAKKRKTTANASDLARSYVKSMKIIGQKTNVKMDPSVKRTICKGCNTLLMPGVTAKVRVKQLPSHGHAVKYTCLHCSTTRRIPAPPILHETPAQPAETRGPLPENNETKEEHMGVQQQQEAQDEERCCTAATEAKAGLKKAQRKGRKRKPIKPRPVPFFQREGHVLFVGNEVAGASL